MVYGIISDIHSNLEAITSVFDELERRGVDKTICLGDVVGYGANPNECCDLLRESTSHIVLGNHDAGSLGLTSLRSFSKMAVSVCQWTGQTLTDENRNWLKGLPLIKEIVWAHGCVPILIVHSAPKNPSQWQYILSLKNAITEFKVFSNQICFVGHSHVPCSFIEQDSRYNIVESPKFTLKPDARYIINPGSIGQPRDKDSRASFAIYEPEHGKVEIVRVEYDIKGAQQKIIDAGLPEFLASRLALGK